MNTWQAIKQKPALLGVFGVVAVALISIGMYRTMGGGESPPSAGLSAQFSDDDGKSWFDDSADKLPPFDHHGKEAVLAVIGTVNDQQKVLYLQRYTPAGKELKLHPKASALDDPAAVDPQLLAQTEVKRPRDAKWVKKTDPRAREIVNP